MKRFVYGVAVIAALFFLAVTAHAFNYPQWPTQQGMPIQANFGFKEIATDTITLDASTPVNLASYLPEGTMGFEIRARSGAFVIAHPNNIATGASRVGRLVEEGESYGWNGLGGAYNGAVVSDAGTCVLVIDGAWGYGR